MKVRFGVSLGADAPPEVLPGLVDRLESLGVDSIWFSELVYAPAVDPFIGMAVALARTERLKVGTSVAVLPGRQPVLVAKQLASLAAIGPRRVLPVFGLRSALPGERALFPVPDGQRAAVFDDALRELRAALDPGRGAGGVAPLPPRPLDIWVGGSSAAAYRRIGRFADGWLGSFLTPSEAGAAREAIERAAEDAGRAVEPDHYGINVAVSEGGLPDHVAAAVARRRPDVDPAQLVGDGWDGLHRLLDGYVAAGLTKFVVRPAGIGTGDPTDDALAFADRFAAELLPRQN